MVCDLGLMSFWVHSGHSAQIIVVTVVVVIIIIIIIIIVLIIIIAIAVFVYITTIIITITFIIELKHSKLYWKILLKWSHNQ